MKKIKNLCKKKIGKILLFIVLDIVLIFLSSFLALWIRFDFNIIPKIYLCNFYFYLFIDIIIMLVIFSCLKLYTSVWSYASIIELINVIIGCLIIEIISFIYHNFLNIMIPRSYFFIRWLLMIVFICGTRFSYRISRSIYLKIQNSNKKINTMIIGAGSCG
ncbi:MAG: polysaccharide biosynthesis protein, partial [bacterium]|nr:polysaccharide biosynthesis protein [bacterium]